MTHNRPVCHKLLPCCSNRGGIPWRDLLKISWKKITTYYTSRFQKARFDIQGAHDLKGDEWWKLLVSSTGSTCRSCIQTMLITRRIEGRGELQGWLSEIKFSFPFGMIWRKVKSGDSIFGSITKYLFSLSWPQSETASSLWGTHTCRHWCQEVGGGSWRGKSSRSSFEALEDQFSGCLWESLRHSACKLKGPTCVASTEVLWSSVDSRDCQAQCILDNLLLQPVQIRFRRFIRYS